MARNTFTVVSNLIKGFPGYLDFFVREPPFNRPEQLGRHLETIGMLRQSGSVSRALENDEFLASLYRTLQAWGIGCRGSNLRPIEQFSDALRTRSGALAELEGLEIDDRSLNPTEVVETVWNLISELDIVENDNPIVSGSKALHHILPNLVVPVDRAYTQEFFGWQNPEFQYGRSDIFGVCLKSFIRVARAVDLTQYLDDGWCSSKTKIIDNAIVGYVCAKE